MAWVLAEKPAQKSGTQGEEGLIGQRVPRALPFRAVPEPQDSRIKPDSQDSAPGVLILPASPHSQAMTWGAQLHSGKLRKLVQRGAELFEVAQQTGQTPAL